MRLAREGRSWWTRLGRVLAWEDRRLLRQVVARWVADWKVWSCHLRLGDTHSSRMANQSPLKTKGMLLAVTAHPPTRPKTQYAVQLGQELKSSQTQPVSQQRQRTALRAFNVIL